MLEPKFQTPTRRKSTIDDFSSYTDKRLKCSTADSSLSAECRLKRCTPLFDAENTHWQTHEHRRESRLNSMLKFRKEKLQEITQENQKIFIRINEQHSHYCTLKPQERLERNRNKENQGDEAVMGHLRQFVTPACFIIGERGIMCEQRLGLDNIVLKKAGRMLPQLTKNDTIQKEYRSIERNPPPKTKELLFYPPNRERRLPDIYMMI